MKQITYLFFASILISCLSNCDIGQTSKEPEISLSFLGDASCNSFKYEIEVGGENDNITQTGICYSTQQNPTTSTSSFTIDGNDAGYASGIVRKLMPSTTYYVRAYAVADGFVYYSGQSSVKTEEIPTAPCSPVKNTFEYNIYHVDFYSTYASVDYYGDYEVEAHGSGGSLRMYFVEEPVSGIYRISPFHESDDQDFDEVRMTGVFGGTFSWLYFPDHEQEIYVENTDDQIIINFCSVHFEESQSGSHLDWDADANITVDK
jgi:hypothetical protein